MADGNESSESSRSATSLVGTDLIPGKNCARRSGKEPIVYKRRLGLDRGCKRDLNGNLIPRNQELGFSLHADEIRSCRLEDLRKLLSSLNAKQREDVRDIGFGGILDVKCESLPDGMNEWLIKQFNPVSQNFEVDGRIVFSLSALDAKRIFGLPYSPGNPVLWFAHDAEVAGFIDSWEQKFGIPDSQNIDLYDSIMMMRRRRGGGEDFKRMFVLYVMQVLLTPQFGTQLELGLIRSLIDVDNIKYLNWAGYVVDHLCDSLYIYSQIKNPKGSEGCLLLLQIAYFHSCIWKGEPPLTEEPFIKHWYGHKIRARLLDEDLAGGFGKGWFLETNQMNAMHCVYPMPGNRTLRQSARISCDGEPFALWNDDEICAGMENGSRKQWQLLRDVENVIFQHIESRSLLGYDLRNACLRQKGNGTIVFNAKAGLDRVIINLFSCCWYINPGSNVRIGNLLDETLGVADPVRDQELTPVEGSPWETWVYNYPAKYSSHLVQQCCTVSHTFSPYKLEVADYCVSQGLDLDKNEILVKDGGNVWLTRGNFNSLDTDQPLQQWIVNMFARLANFDWVQKGIKTRIAFETLELSEGEDDWNQKLVVWGWRSWINLCNINVRDANFVLIPVTWKADYYLVVVDFSNMKIHCIEARKLHDEVNLPEERIRAIGSAFSRLLLEFRDERAEHVKAFSYERVTPYWSVDVVSADSGVCVMYMMERYCGSTFAIDLLELNQTKKRIQLRVAYSCYMVFSDLNAMRTAVLDKIPAHMSKKNNHTLAIY